MLSSNTLHILSTFFMSSVWAYNILICTIMFLLEESVRRSNIYKALTQWLWRSYYQINLYIIHLISWYMTISEDKLAMPITLTKYLIIAYVNWHYRKWVFPSVAKQARFAYLDNMQGWGDIQMKWFTQIQIVWICRSPYTSCV